MSWVFFLLFSSSFLVTFCVMSGLLYSLSKNYICFHYDPSNQPTRITTNKQIKKSYFIILIFKNKTIQYCFLMSDWIFIKGMFFSLSTLHSFFYSQVGSRFFLLLMKIIMQRKFAYAHFFHLFPEIFEFGYNSRFANFLWLWLQSYNCNFILVYPFP